MKSNKFDVHITISGANHSQLWACSSVLPKNLKKESDNTLFLIQ